MPIVKKDSEITAQLMGGETPGVTMRELISHEDGAPNFAMRQFSLVPEAQTPFHIHPWEHEVYVLEGIGVVESESGETPIGQDFAVYVAPNEKHCFRNTGTGILRFLCVIPAEKKCCSG